MMTDKDYIVVTTLKNKLSQVIAIVDLRVFGSRARDSVDEYSDIDVFLEVLFLNKDLKNQIYDIAWEVGFENFVVISVLIFTRDEIENSPLRASPIVENIFAEGIKV